MSYTSKLIERGLIHPPKWLENNVLFEGLTGSVSYGVSNDSSDMDVVGFCMPPKDVIFPHLRGEIHGFGTPGEVFNQFQQHHIKAPDLNKEFDVTIYSVVKFFQLCMENRPAQLEAIFLPRRCILHSTAIYEHIKTNRKMFLHKGGFHSHKGYAMSQLSKIKNKTNSSNPKRSDLIQQFGFDTKFAMHAVRLYLQIEQIMLEGNLVVDRNATILRGIRNGEWELEKIIEWCSEKESQLEKAYIETNEVPHKPNEQKIRDLLLECITMHYGKVSDNVLVETSSILDDLRTIITKHSM